MEKIFSSRLCKHGHARKGRKEREKRLCMCASPHTSPCDRISVTRERERQREITRERESNQNRKKRKREEEKEGRRRKFSPPHACMHAHVRRHERGEGEGNKEIMRERESNRKR